MIDGYSGEIRTKAGMWIKLERIETRNLQFYSIGNGLERAIAVDLTPRIDNLLSFRWLQPKENVNGWIFFEYPQGSDADGFEPIFRIGVRDAAGVQFTTGELTAQESIQSSMIDVKPGTRNLNGVPIQLPGEPQPATTAPHTAPAAGTASFGNLKERAIG